MVTAEFAVGLLAVVPLLLALIALTAVGAQAARGQEAARVAARLLARGEAQPIVVAKVQESLPQARISVWTEADIVHVQVEQTAGGMGLLPQFTITGKAATPVEHG